LQDWSLLSGHQAEVLT